MAQVNQFGASESIPAIDCGGACLQTRDWSPLEPDVSEFKFYVPGIGVILAYDVEEPEIREELIDYYILDL